MSWEVAMVLLIVILVALLAAIVASVRWLLSDQRNEGERRFKGGVSPECQRELRAQLDVDVWRNMP